MTTTSRPRATLFAPITAVAALAAMTLAPPLAATAAGSSTAPSAPSSRLVHIDPAHDVQTSSMEDENLQPAPKRADVDIRRFNARYENDTVVLRMLTRKAMPARNVAVIGLVRTPSRDFDITYNRLFGERSLTLNKGPRTVKCDGLGAIVMKGDRYFVDDALSSRAGDNLTRSAWIHRG